MCKKGSLGLNEITYDFLVHVLSTVLSLAFWLNSKVEL